MKKFNRILLVLSVFMFSLFVGNINAKAEVTEADMFYNDKTQDMTISVTFEKNDVKVTFVAPDGTVMDPLKPNDKMTVFTSDTAIYVAIKDAMEGQWKIRYDKGSNSEIRVGVDGVETPIWVTDITTYDINGTILPVEFYATQEGSDRWYDYVISIATDNNFGAAKEILRGNGVVNEKIHVDLDLAGYNSYSEYYVMVRVYYYDKDMEFFDVGYSDKFSFTNPNATENISDFHVTVDENANGLTVNWADVLPGGTKEVFLRFTEDENEPEEFAVGSGEGETTYEYSDGAKKVKVEMYAIFDNGRMSDATTKEIKIEKGKDDFSIDLGESGLTNSTALDFTYSNAFNQEITTKLNNDEEVKMVLNGDGRKQINLTQDTNEFHITYTDADGIVRKLSKVINIDRIAPSLELFEKIDGSVTSKETIIVTGKTTGADKLTINGEEVEVRKEGTFKHTVNLEEGKNDISVRASDVAGNTTLYQAQVTYSKDDAVVTKDADGVVDVKATVKKWLPLIIAGACSLVGLIILIVAAVKKKKLKKLIAEGKAPTKLKRVFYGFRTASIATFILTVASITYYVIRYQFMHSEEFIQLAYSSVADADNYMKITDYVKYAMIGCIIVFCLFTAIAVIINVIINAQKKPKKEKPAKVKKEKPVKEKAVSQPAQAAAEAPKQENTISFCPECGAKLPINSAFCQNCGYKVKQ